MSLNLSSKPVTLLNPHWDLPAIMRPEDELIWFPDRGMGYYPVRDPGPYDQAYFDRYKGYEGTDVCLQLNQFRVDWVKRFVSDDEFVIDFGCGAGTFITARGTHTAGYDINPSSQAWLHDNHRMSYPYREDVPHMTAWDSLEHLHDPSIIVRRISVGGYLFASLPIFDDMAHVCTSKHFRPTEHFWYWTHQGFIDWVESLGFECLDHDDVEQKCGREDIHTFVFQRVENA